MKETTPRSNALEASKALSFFERVLAHPIVKETVEWQIFNLVGAGWADLEQTVHAELIDHACVSIAQSEFSPLVAPDFANPEWKHAFAVESEEPVLARIYSGEYDTLVNEFKKKHTQGQRDRFIIEFSLYRVATAATQVARMMKLDLDPELLRLEPETSKREIKVKLFKRSNVRLQ